MQSLRSESETHGPDALIPSEQALIDSAVEQAIGKRMHELPMHIPSDTQVLDGSSSSE